MQSCRDFFYERDFVLIDSPILTPNACEGTSTLFQTPYFDDTAYLTLMVAWHQIFGAHVSSRVRNAVRGTIGADLVGPEQCPGIAAIRFGASGPRGVHRREIGIPHNHLMS